MFPRSQPSHALNLPLDEYLPALKPEGSRQTDRVTSPCWKNALNELGIPGLLELHGPVTAAFDANPTLPGEPDPYPIYRAIREQDPVH